MGTKKETTRLKVIKRLRRIANEEGLTYSEVHKVFMSQFKFAKEQLEAFDPKYLENASEAELERHVFNFLYLGKIHTKKKLQKLANKRKYEKRRGFKHNTDK